MYKNILSVIFTLIAFTAFGQTKNIDTYQLDIKDFGELQVVDNLNVIHRCNPDSAGFAVFTCPKDVVPHLLFTNTKNKLKIQTQNDDNVIREFPTVTVYSSFLSSAENSGDSTVIVDKPAPGAVFKARIIGNGTLIVRDIHATQTEGKLDTGRGHLVLTGATRTAKLTNIGTGTIEAGNLTAENGVVTILGTGAIDCNVSKDLMVKGMGTGKVYVKGDPKIKQRSIGSVKVINVE